MEATTIIRHVGAEGARTNISQGEWLFMPTDLQVPDREILRNEPLQRSPGNKPHWCEEAYRGGNELVYVVSGESDILSEAEYRQRKLAEPDFDRRGVRTKVGNPQMFVRGRIRHPDHATIVLLKWHRVLSNAGGIASDVPSVAFLD